jgi:uncharacterized integral membrane protein
MFMVLLAVLLFLLVTAGLAVIVFLNTGSSVSLAILGWHSPTLSVGLLILLAFFLGAFLLYLLSVTSAWHDNRELKQMRRRVTDLEQTVAAHRAASALSAAPNPHAPVIPMPGMPPPDISDLPTQH